MEHVKGENALYWMVFFDPVAGLEADLHSDVQGKHLLLLDKPQEIVMAEPPTPGEKFWLTFVDDGVGESTGGPSESFVPVPA